MAVVQKQFTIDLAGQVQSGTMVSLDFDALPGSNPKALGYFIAIWQGSQIQALENALTKQDIETGTQAGSTTFENLALADLDYIIGFGVDSDSGTSICATLNIPKGSPRFTPLETNLSTLELQYSSSNSLIATFVTPPYNLAATNNNWVALFKGQLTANMYKGLNVITTTMVEDNTNEGAVAMNKIPDGLVRFQKYTLVYGMGLDKSGKPNYSNLVSAAEFTVS
ncbi:hypothetical protein [Flavobacterium sp. NKUCC04_CG]|uniref:hypothetical protein n=1 Tax=Flavobacterium sp. NKUCC04_CG TaxID=2842121 RepID=UPI001C5B2CBB|nr:hypothetical protein [Flavobacterium sp. NKUCC04_CG]MBW3519859.1 hypothetical protein [Flavobacterium sp. NKUCC04_CG]